MRKDIHPAYSHATVACSCGESFKTRSTKAELKVELCSKCHPFYSGVQKLVDTGGRVQRFQQKYGHVIAENAKKAKAKDNGSTEEAVAERVAGAVAAEEVEVEAMVAEEATAEPVSEQVETDAAVEDVSEAVASEEAAAKEAVAEDQATKIVEKAADDSVEVEAGE